MNLISFLFFGSPEELESTILKKLKVVDYKPATDDHKGLYLAERKYGQEELRKVSIDYKDKSSEDWLLFKYLSPEDADDFKNKPANTRIYVLTHNYYSFEHFISNELVRTLLDEIIFVVDSANDEFKTSDYIRKKTKSKNIAHIKKVYTNKKEQIETEDRKGSLILSFLGSLVKIVLNPANELSHFLSVLRYSNLRYSGRFLELFLFFHFVVKMLLFVPLQIFFIKTWFFLIMISGWSKVLIIKLGYLSRHLLLMSGFKSFGFLVDLRNLIVRFKDLLLEWSYYKFIHRIFYDYIYFGFGKLFVFISDIYFKYIHSVYFKYVHKLYFKYIHRFYFEYIRKYSLIFYYMFIHAFYHNFFKKIIDYVWVNLVSKFIFDFLISTIYHKILKLGFNTVRMVFNHLYFRIVLKTYYFLKEMIYYTAFLGFFHKVLKPFVSFVKYDLVLKFFYSTLYPGYHRISASVKNFLRYSLRHWILMSYFKTYGLVYDAATFTYRIFKLYLLYPVFKVYWFSKFQYNKRIKKIFKNG